jgi:ABC-2 type transport system ATP-binding protein
MWEGADHATIVVMDVISMNAVHKRFGRQTVLHDVSMRVRPGSVYGLLGPNGAGKSTTLSILVGLLTPTSGEVELFGRPWERSSLARLGASINGPALYPHLDGRDNLRVHADLLGLGRTEVDAALTEVGLDDAGRRRVGQYSTGMRSRLATAIALLGHPELVVLDEPQNGLDPAGIRFMRQLMRRIADTGATVVFSSHLLSEVAATADDIGCIVGGRTRFEGPRTAFAPDGDLESAYFDLFGVRSDGPGAVAS